MRLVFVAALITLFDPQQPLAPAPPQTFRSGAQIVEVDVRVLGKDGRFVTGLGLPDFEITEDGVPQKIQSVVLVGTDPAPAAAPAPSPATPATPSAPLARRPEQTWLFVFDTAHLTAGPLQRAREAVVKFIAEKFRDGDLGGVVVDGKIANNRLTTDREELKKAAAGVKMPGELRSRQLEMQEWPRLRDEGEAFRIVRNDRDAIQSAVARACAEDPDQCRRVPADLQVMNKAKQMVTAYRTATLQTLTVVEVLSKGLARLPGPKTIVFFSEGFVLEEQESQLRQAVGQAARAGAHFYTVDARGLNRGSGSQIIDAPMPDNPMGAQPTFDAQADGTNSLAIDTGGFAIRNENNFGRALDDIQKDAGTYYVVGYVPANEVFDGKYRAISVKVSRPGVKVRARRGYLALEPAALLRPTAATASKSASAGGESPAGYGGTKAGSVTSELPVVPVSPGLLALPETLTVTLPGEAAPLPERNAASAAAVRARIDGGKMVMALGRAPDSAPAYARLHPPGSGEASSALNPAAELGWAAYEKGDVETAARHLSEAAKAPDARPWVIYALGLSQFALRRIPEAAEAWERVRREVPEFEPIYFSLADAYGLQHEESTALKVLREAERRWPSDAEVANAIGVIQIRRGALDAAVESFERATRIAPEDALGYFNLARAHQMRLLKSQRYDRQMQKWIGGDEDRRRAIASFQKYLALGGPYERQAQEALASLSWK
jgi:VWFA-related protein